MKNKIFNFYWRLVEGDLVELLIQRGIPIADTTTRLKGKRADGGKYEFDIIAHSGEEMVVEVKTTLKPQDVEDFINRLNFERILNLTKLLTGLRTVRSPSPA